MVFVNIHLLDTARIQKRTPNDGPNLPEETAESCSLFHIHESNFHKHDKLIYSDSIPRFFLADPRFILLINLNRNSSRTESTINVRFESKSIS